MTLTRNPITASGSVEATASGTRQGIEIAAADGLAPHHTGHADGDTGDSKNAQRP
ncbi:hypothetical protein [Candidatus Poriferisodalis sp.]|uniref:hypothetical protein n=1 Tax=Candidatus Poriferisodalis sp. TaxID=3101277 RepID=UPI003B01ADAD